MEGSLALAAEAVVNGVSHIIATPHARFPFPDDWFAGRRRADPAMLAALDNKVDLVLAGSRFLHII